MSNFYDNDDLLWDSEISDAPEDKQKDKRNKHNRRQLSDLKRQSLDQDQPNTANHRRG
jgi:hypothetical protein